MKIRTKLALLFTLLVATILLGFATAIYLSAKYNRETEFYELLKKEAITKLNLLLQAKINDKTLQTIYKNNRQILNETEVAIYDSRFQLIYHDAVEIDVVKETPQMLTEILQKGLVQFTQNRWQVVGIRYEWQGEKYLVTASAFDGYGYSKLNALWQNILIAFIVGILIIFVVGRYFASKVLRPIQEINSKVKQITATNLDLRLKTSKNQDEISQLAQTFNEMLDRLEKSFDAQKHFVSNISHELRTPLSAIVTELELALHKERNISDYQQAIRNTLSDAKRLIRLSNSLLDLAKADYAPSEITFKPAHIEEILLDTIQQFLQANPHYKVEIDFQETEKEVFINANEYLLKTAFSNLLENACKFSPEHTCKVKLTYRLPSVQVQFIDKGIGIADSDLEAIFAPFFRGKNQQFAKGSGIGLFLTKKILQLHQADIQVFSQVGEGTTFTLTFQQFLMNF
ncbi:MAG: ATP-binding protein [Raineya sp.]|nr:ATP-binding protein [Raineya sp.]